MPSGRTGRGTRIGPGVAVMILVIGLAGCSSGAGASGGATTSASGAVVSSASSGAAESGAAGATSYPLTIENCGREITFDALPSRVLILNGTSVGEVESFIMLGLEDSILANAQHYAVSDDPDMIAKIDALPTGNLTMNDNFDVPAEQVLAAKPDLVVSTWAGGFESQYGFATRDQLAAAGINTYINPANCAYGNPNASADEQVAYEKRSMQSSFDMLTELGVIFDVPDRAAALVSDLQGRIDAVSAKVAGLPTKSVLIAYPGMSMMNANGLPAVMTGGVYDDVLRAAGATNSFPAMTDDVANSLNKEQLASAGVDVLAIGAFTEGEDQAAEAKQLFAEYPQWAASATGSFVPVADSVYFGPLNYLAVEKIAKAVHPDAFD